MKAPSPIAGLLNGPDATLKQLARGAADLKPFQQAWRNIVPSTAYDYIRPAFYRDGKLTVWVRSPVWANWIRHRQQWIISRIHDLELRKPLPRVHTLIVRLAPEKGAGPALDPRKPREETSRSIEQSARTIDDPGLRAALEQLARTLKNPR